MYNGEKLLVCNRGEIAIRILRTAREMGLATLAVYTPSDALSPHVALADESVQLSLDNGESELHAYCASEQLLSICKTLSVTLVHPGYGFLSETSAFAQSVIDCGMTWLGPAPGIIRTMGIKHEARHVAEGAGVAVVPGSKGLVASAQDALEAARMTGFPVILKATAGGGGMGLLVCNNEEELAQKFVTASERAESLFHDHRLFVERYFPNAHHIEIQVFGDGRGVVVHMGERECSIQRRHQKVIEEAPSPLCILKPGLRDALLHDAVHLCKSIQYGSAGTVEFIVDDDSYTHFFLEMNTRIQVEHPVTEMLYPGLDIVKMMIDYGVAERRARIYSENPFENFKPCPGVLQYVDFKSSFYDWLRVESWVSTGTTITPFFDPLVCKLIATGTNREEALQRILTILMDIRVDGPPNNIEYLQQIVQSSAFKRGRTLTTLLNSFPFKPLAFTVLAAGLETSVQDLPGRSVGLGIPESGPMDPLAFQAANILVGNNQTTEGLETILVGEMEMTLQFHTKAVIAVTGKEVKVMVNGAICNMWSAIAVPEDGTLTLKSNRIASGLRTYIAFLGGFPGIPSYLGSKSTSMGLGGYQGRSLISGDQISLNSHAKDFLTHTQRALPKHAIPVYPEEWKVYVLNGPHNDQGFVSSTNHLYSTPWKISASSNRMGIRLESLGDNISWARASGGEGGSHPSNILDNGYAHGTVNINGDTPVILTKEGPDMGGYVCLCTVASAEMWKLGQLGPGNVVQFIPLTWDEARDLAQLWDRWLKDLEEYLLGHHSTSDIPTVPSLNQYSHFQGDSKLYIIPSSFSRPEVVFRQAGDSAILVEFGPMTLDLTMRARIHAFESEFKNRNILGFKKFCPCIRSTMCHFDPSLISQKAFILELVNTENAVPDILKNMVFPGRRFVLPIVLDDPWSQDAVERYMKSSRTKAVYLPSNVEYLARNNGLSNSKEALQKLVQSDHLVLGVGFYLACPFSVPIDPRCRLVGQKMNPSRTYTPRGAIGIAGLVAAIYPVESPGGYQLFGRTLPSWQTWGRGTDFKTDQPWLLQPFDQIHFEVIQQDEYEKLEKDFDAGRYKFKIEDCLFSMREYTQFIDSIAEETTLFRKNQAEAVSGEEQRENQLLEEWLLEQKQSGDITVEEHKFSDGLIQVSSPLFASVWKILAHPGTMISSADQVLVILEAMKTEIPVKGGDQHIGMTVEALGTGIKEGAMVQSGDALLFLK